MSDPRPSYRALARRPGYTGFLLTVSLSRTTGAMFTTTGVLLVLARTHSVFLAGATAAAASFPAALSSPLLGALLDVSRHRRALVVLDHLASVVALTGLLVLAGHGPDWAVPAIAVLHGITRGLTVGSFLSAIAELAGPELLDRASALEATSLNLAYVIGPALGGLLAGLAGASTAMTVQIGLTLLAALLIAANPTFDVRPPRSAARAGQALRDGLTALLRARVLRVTALASWLAVFGWGMMSVGFPLLALRTHAGAHAGGYLWAALALGSILGTFGVPGAPSTARVALFYALHALSALPWLVAGTLLPGLLAVGLTGILEGPAYSGTIALRQRHAPVEVKAGLMTTVSGIGVLAYAAGAALAGLVERIVPLVIAFVLVNLLAAAVVAGRTRKDPPRRRHRQAAAGAG